MRSQMLDNLYYNLFGDGARHLPLEARVEIYLEADGFGDTRSGEARANMLDYMRHGWDWSHVRDSSDEALERTHSALTALFRRIIAEQRAAEVALVRERIAEAIAARMREGASYDEATAEAFAYCNERWPTVVAALIAEAA